VKYLSILLLILCCGCQTYITRSGKKTRQAFPAKDPIPAGKYDTARFVLFPFSLVHYMDKFGYVNGKKIIVPVKGTDISNLALKKGRFYIHFWNPGCSANYKDIPWYDSLQKAGEQVILISLRRDYSAIDRILSKTSFSQFPYYTIEDEKYSDKLLVRQSRFIQEACKPCYAEYKDEVIWTKYLLIENSNIKVVR
jgi:hypothetical protein